MKKLVLLIVITAHRSLYADTNTTVVPIGFENQAGNLNDSIVGGEGHFQELFRASTFAAPWDTPVEINGIAFRLETGSASGGALIPRVEIHLSTSSRSPEQMSLIYAINKGSDETTVFLHDNVLVSSSAQQAVNPFDFRFIFDQPFIYDPKAGNLLLYMQTTGSFGGRQIDAQGYANLGSSSGSYVGTTFSDNQVVPFTPVIEFSWVPVPEPSGLTLALFGGAILYRLRNKT